VNQKYTIHSYIQQTTFNSLFFPGQPGKPVPERLNQPLFLMKQETIGWQWHHLDHMQIICTLLQADNHASTLSVIFYKPDALPDAEAVSE